MCYSVKMLLKVFILFVISVAVESGSCPNFQYQWYEGIGSCKVHLVPARWREARLQCLREGAALASTRSPSALTGLMRTAGRQRVFLGIHATESKRVYNAIDGTPLEEINICWAPNEPNNLNESEECLALNIDGTVADVQCSDPLPYICCKGPQDTTNDDYVCDNLTNKCYKFYHYGKTWSEAFKICAAESGHLAIIRSAHEAEYIRELIHRIPTTSMKADYSDFAFVGFRLWDKPDVWMTVHGQRFENTGYSTWGTNQPDNEIQNGVGEDCGSFVFSGELHDVSCLSTLPFVCEKSRGTIAPLPIKNPMGPTMNIDY